MRLVLSVLLATAFLLYVAGVWTGIQIERGWQG